MFLNNLKANQKQYFLNLAKYIMDIDENYGDKEKDIILGYANEMGIKIENIDYFDRENFDLEKIVSVFKDKTSQKIVVLELMALIYADNQVDEKEEEFIQYLCDKFKISREQVLIYEEWTKAILALYKQGELFINV